MEENRAYYNEIDPKAAAWLRELIEQGHIANGEVDERSIEDVTPNDLRGFTQCHFFAGIGVWSYALRLAGWPDDRPVWTGSCPCQPFSAAGKGKGFDDERHLWPAFHHLIRVCRPAIIFGEQVAHKAGATWFDLVQADLAGEDYASGMVVFPACGVGAPHMRQRLYWVGYPRDPRLQRHGRPVEELSSEGREAPKRLSATPSLFDELVNAAPSGRREECAQSGRSREGGEPEGRPARLGDGSASQQLADASSSCDRNQGPMPTNGFWRDVDWLGCRDGKWRPVEPGTFPLVDGAPKRVGRLRGYGNAIVAPQAQAFIRSYMEVAHGRE